VSPQRVIVKNVGYSDLFCHNLQLQKGSSIRKEKFYIILLKFIQPYNKLQKQLTKNIET
jgi:hypothetical protein